MMKNDIGNKHQKQKNRSVRLKYLRFVDCCWRFWCCCSFLVTWYNVLHVTMLNLCNLSYNIFYFGMSLIFINWLFVCSSGSLYVLHNHYCHFVHSFAYLLHFAELNISVSNIYPQSIWPTATIWFSNLFLATSSFYFQIKSHKTDEKMYNNTLYTYPIRFTH